jgi:hypothetical protein
MTRQRSPKLRILGAVVPFIAVLTVLIVLAATAIAQNPVPFIDQPLVPDATAPGGAGFTLTVNGAGFVPASVVNWNGSPRATTFVSRSKLTATILASDIAKASTAAVTVVNPNPGGGTSNTQFFSITAAETSASFLPPVTYDTGGYNPSSVAIADLRGTASSTWSWRSNVPAPTIVPTGQGQWAYCWATATEPSRHRPTTTRE